VKSAVCDDLKPGIVYKDAVSREPATHNYIIALSGCIEDVSQFGQKALAIAVKR
jgi:hypothetical protein